MTLFPWWLNRIRVTLEFPGLLKQMICWEWPHSNILTLPSWAPVRSGGGKVRLGQSVLRKKYDVDTDAFFVAALGGTFHQ